MQKFFHPYLHSVNHLATPTGPSSACWQTAMRSPPALVRLMRKSCFCLSLRVQWGRRDPHRPLMGKHWYEEKRCFKEDVTLIKSITNEYVTSNVTFVWQSTVLRKEPFKKGESVMFSSTRKCYFYPSVLWMLIFLQQKINCGDITLQMAVASIYISGSHLSSGFDFSIWILNLLSNSKLLSSNPLSQDRGREDREEDFEICGQNR